jgi:hypothetical protein
MAGSWATKAITLAVALCAVIAAPARGADPRPPGIEESSEDGPVATDPETARLTAELQRETLKAQIARTRFATAADAYQERMYRHHQFWTDAAAVMVYFITLFGLFCAAVQFRLVARLKGQPVTADEISAGAIELPGGAKMNSPFLGLLILFVSLAFYYLYLTNVYPILSVAEIEAKRGTAPAEPKR